MNSQLSFANALERIAELRQRYLADRCIFIPSVEMKELVFALGATPSDLEAFQHESDLLEVDPTLAFRRSRNGRYCFVPEQREIYRTIQQPFVLSAEEDFVRHDSGKIREFASITPSAQGNPVLQALLAINALIVEGSEVEHRPGLNYASPNWITTAFHLRTITTPELVGEPALEGVHQDGVDHTMTIFLNSKNMVRDSATTRLHSNQEASGTQWYDQNLAHVLGTFQHQDVLDTLIVVDHERKHSVSAVTPIEPSAPATRDMLILFTRKPALGPHVSHEYDSDEVNEQAPLTINLPIAILAQGA
ncbi:2OG-Fe dioxygenase family protein [Kocuria marina]|uniref:2OG-Fe dioxygenase family protein n=1 Tax=Kocuria marina TaxID=223184 RepID=UPI0011A3778B|nr:2OG-Fe dioxygenase family protein [Kocuria indica]